MASLGRRDKYESNVKEYWVAVETTGSFDNEHEESLTDRTCVEGQAATFDLGIQPVMPPGVPEEEEEDENGLEDEDQDDARTTVGPGGKPLELESALEAVAYMAWECLYAVSLSILQPIPTRSL